MLSKLFFKLAYLQSPVWDTGISPPELLDFIAAHTPGQALDLGCGTGTNAITLAQHGWLVTGVDFTPMAIRRAKQKAKEKQVKVDLRLADVTQLRELTGPFDLIFDLGCFHSLPTNSRQAYIANVVRLLADTGTFLLYTFIRTGPSVGLPGSTEAELQVIDQSLHIVERKDGTERGLFASAWLTIQKRS